MSTRFREVVAKWSKIVQFWILPGVCILCRRNSGRELDLCPACEAQLVAVPDPCSYCGQPLPTGSVALSRCGACVVHGTAMTRTLAPLAWKEPVSGLVSAFKYQAKLHYGRVLSELFAARLHAAYQQAPLPNLLLPVPLHPGKLSARGFNQSLLIARHLQKALAIPVADKLAKRVRNTPAQQGLSAAERKRNLRRAFVADASRLARLPPHTCIALVDDVVTTMSTALALKTALTASATVPLQFHLWALARA